MKLSKWARHLYQPVLPLGKDGRRVTGGADHIALSRRAAAEGMVLLKNEKNVLPVRRGTRVALFGKAGADYVKGGGGSGDVTVAYIRNLIDGMRIKEQEGKVCLYEPLNEFYEADVQRQYAQGIVPGLTAEPALPQDLLKGAGAFAELAIVSICRFSGENWDRTTELDAGRKTSTELSGPEGELLKRAARVFERGDFYLSAAEERLIAQVKEAFDKVVIVLNTGAVISSSWFAQDPGISSVLMAWQAGMEGGLAEADILCGDVNPSGKLADTFAGRLEDYPFSEDFHQALEYVNYTEIIPVVSAAVREIYDFYHNRSQARMLANGGFWDDATDGMRRIVRNEAALSQNSPNPFAGNTAVRYELPEGTREAHIAITDMLGRPVALQPMDIGSSSTTISSAGLMPGMYIYTLVADGAAIGTRRMIVNK